MRLENPVTRTTQVARKPRRGGGGRSAGFTLIELMVVVIVLAILAGSIVAMYSNTPNEAKVSRAMMDIKNLENALELFSLKNDGKYPTSEEGLKVLEEGYVKEILPDPWDRPYQYVCPGSSGRNFDLFSFGADGEPGGTEFDADITSWKSEEEK